MPQADDTWEGGYIRRDARGRTVYIIRRQAGGKRYEVSTRCTTHRAALSELARWEADPGGYTPKTVQTPEQRRDPIPLTEALCDDFLMWSRDTKGNTPRWVNEQQAYLAWWRERLGEVDLRRASLTADILPALEGAPKPTRAKRIAVLKALYGWLRSVVYRLSAAEDPTYGTLKVPPSRAAAQRRDAPASEVAAALIALTPTYRDGLTVQAGTGWHVTELVRFARAGLLEVALRPPPGVYGVLTCPMHKDGQPKRTAVSRAVYEAAERVRQRGTLNRRNYDMAVRDLGGVLRPGAMRHTVSMHALAEGASTEQIGDFLRHDPKTNRQFYSRFGVATKVPTPL